MVDLGTLGGQHSSAAAINDLGVVVGSSETASGGSHLFLWSQDSGIEDIGGNESYAPSAINGNGHVVGSQSIPALGTTHAFSWTRESGFEDLGTLGGVASGARAVNESGQAIGTSFTASGDLHAFSWTEAGGMKDLGTLHGGSSTPWALNDSGQVVGESVTLDARWRAFSWTEDGGMKDLGTLGGDYSVAYGVTDGGRVFGVSTVGTGEKHAFSWTEADGMVDLGRIELEDWMSIQTVTDSGQFVGNSLIGGGHAFSWTEDGGMADLGTLGGLGSRVIAAEGPYVVGQSDTEGNFESHAFVWTRAGGMVDLRTFGGTASEAIAVNRRGQIVGTSSYGGEWPPSHAVLWTPENMDATPPVITVPADFAVNATSPDGAVVTYAASASDEDPASPTVTCAPLSGSLLPIGVTEVTCRAEDAAGNDATASFAVTVKGAAEQFADLLAAAREVGPGSSLSDKVAEAQAEYAAGNRRRACDILGAFVNQVEAASGKTVEQTRAEELIADARRVRAVIGC